MTNIHFNEKAPDACNTEGSDTASTYAWDSDQDMSMREVIIRIISANRAPLSEAIVAEILLFMRKGYLAYPMANGGYGVGDGTGSLRFCDNFEQLQFLARELGLHK
jgi:hypothetical protein